MAPLDQGVGLPITTQLEFLQESVPRTIQHSSSNTLQQQQQQAQRLLHLRGAQCTVLPVKASQADALENKSCKN